jgi:hypothetical protein
VVRAAAITPEPVAGLPGGFCSWPIRVPRHPRRRRLPERARIRSKVARPGAQNQQIWVSRTRLTDPLTARASDEQRRLCAAVGHAISFWTWRSLCLDQGLTDTEAVALMTGMVLVIAPMSAEPAR